MSLLDIGLRNLPNLYVGNVQLDQREYYIPKMKVSLVLKDAIINNKLFWSNDPSVMNSSRIVFTLEDQKGRIYLTKKEPIISVLENSISETDSKNNITYLYKMERVIDSDYPYYKDKSLILKTYVEKTDPDGTVYKSSVMREVIQNSDGSTPSKSFYFTLADGQVYSGPFHYNDKTDQFMLGDKHSSAPHPVLTINYIRNKTISSNSLHKTLSYINNSKNTYNFNPNTIISNYVTKNNDRSVSNLFVIDLYKILLQIDEDSQKLFELNKEMLADVIKELSILEMNVGRIELGQDRYDNILYTPVLKSAEKGIEKHLITLNNVKESRYRNDEAEVEVYFDDDVLYALLTDYHIKSVRDGKYKYITDLRLSSTVSDYIDKKLSSIYRIISYYELFLNSLENSSLYNKSYHKLTNSYLKDIFAEYTSFQSNSDKTLIMNQTPEFHKHIDSFIQAAGLLKSISEEEQGEMELALEQLINPIETSQDKIQNFIKLCRDLAYQITSSYNRNRTTKNNPVMKRSSRLYISLRDNAQFEYSNAKKSFNIFKKLKRPVVSSSFLKKRFTTERTRYFQKSLGDTQFNTLPTPLRAAFVSDKGNSYGFLSPIGLQTNDKDIDLENFDIFDGVAESIYPSPSLKVESKIKSSLTLIDKNLSYLDSATIVGEASDFIINKIKLKRNVFSEIDPIVLNYTFTLNNIIDIDDSKFNLEKQENLLLSFVKNLDESEAPRLLKGMPFQTKSLFYPENLRNPLNRIKATNNFKVKRLIKTVAFTSYRVEYLEGYRKPSNSNSLRNIHTPSWRNMQNPDSLKSNSKFYLLKMTSNDQFGFRSAREFQDNQKFVLLKNNKYQESINVPARKTFSRKYTKDDFSISSYHTLNLLDDDIKKTTMISTRNPETAEWNQARYQLLNSISNSKTVKTRSRRSINESKIISKQVEIKTTGRSY